MYFFWILISAILSTLGFFSFYPNYEDNMFPLFTDITTIFIILPSLFILMISILPQIFCIFLRKIQLKICVYIFFSLISFITAYMFITEKKIVIILYTFIAVIHLLISLFFLYIGQKE